MYEFIVARPHSIFQCLIKNNNINGNASPQTIFNYALYLWVNRDQFSVFFLSFPFFRIECFHFFSGWFVCTTGALRHTHTRISVYCFWRTHVDPLFFLHFYCINAARINQKYLQAINYILFVMCVRSHRKSLSICDGDGRVMQPPHSHESMVKWW